MSNTKSHIEISLELGERRPEIVLTAGKGSWQLEAAIGCSMAYDLRFTTDEPLGQHDTGYVLTRTGISRGYRYELYTTSPRRLPQQGELDTFRGGTTCSWIVSEDRGDLLSAQSNETRRIIKIPHTNHVAYCIALEMSGCANWRHTLEALYQQMSVGMPAELWDSLDYPACNALINTLGFLIAERERAKNLKAAMAVIGDQVAELIRAKNDAGNASPTKRLLNEEGLAGGFATDFLLPSLEKISGQLEASTTWRRPGDALTSLSPHRRH